MAFRPVKNPVGITFFFRVTNLSTFERETKIGKINLLTGIRTKKLMMKTMIIFFALAFALLTICGC
jgi:hypothetical protein